MLGKRIALFWVALVLQFGLQSLSSASAQNRVVVAHWDFSRGVQGWAKSPDVTDFQRTSQGLIFRASKEDPYVFSPLVSFPSLPFVTVRIRMRSNGGATGQLFYGENFSEPQSRTFRVIPDNRWHDYPIHLQGVSGKNRLRLDPGNVKGEYGVAWIHVEASATPPDLPAEAWASPQELRRKKVIGAGQYGQNGGDRAVTSRYLAKHPEFADSFPFDGYVVPVLLESPWAEKAGLIPRDYFLHELLWNRIKIPYEALAPALRDLKSVRWGHLTDNFLNYTLNDGAKGRFTPDLSDDNDWAILEHNAAMAARLCREANLKGFWFDTEQYGNYRWRTQSGTPEYDLSKPQGLKFPLGKDTPEVLKRRGAQWIKAVQAELPAVKIIITFAWSPDTKEYGPLKGADPFFDGVLSAIKAPAQLIHGYENTFYYGQAAGTQYTQEGFAGGRERYLLARDQMRAWRSFSQLPLKYDAFLKVGMAAWVEDDPWNLWDGLPSGLKWSFWSNLPLALAYSDEYVWVWSEHTQYGRTGDLNPFLASISNQTFNRGDEAVWNVSEAFQSDPLRRGWHFDFDMLEIGRKNHPTHETITMSSHAVPYGWSQEAKAIRVVGAWQKGTRRDVIACSDQRRRYVRPIAPLDPNKSFQTCLQVRFESLETTPKNPIVLGLFRHNLPLQQGSLSLRIASPNAPVLALATQGRVQEYPLPIAGGLKTGVSYQFRIAYDKNTKRVRVSLQESQSGGALLAKTTANLPKSVGAFQWDEFGIALWESKSAETSTERPYRYLLEKASLQR